MNLRKQLVAATCMVLATSIMGCPLAGPLTGPLVFGPYKAYFDDGCDGVDDSVEGLFLYSDGTLEYISNGVVKSGEWTVDGSAFGMTIFDHTGETDLIGEATVAANSLENGTYSVQDILVTEGCFHANKSNFQGQ